MKKKIALIVFGSLFAVVGLVAALFYLKGPFVGFPGSRTADGSRAVTDGGVKVGRQVIDKTGLTGEYDFTLEWTHEPPRYRAKFQNLSSG